MSQTPCQALLLVARFPRTEALLFKPCVSVILASCGRFIPPTCYLQDGRLLALQDVPLAATPPGGCDLDPAAVSPPQQAAHVVYVCVCVVPPSKWRVVVCVYMYVYPASQTGPLTTCEVNAVGSDSQALAAGLNDCCRLAGCLALLGKEEKKNKKCFPFLTVALMFQCVGCGRLCRCGSSTSLSICNNITSH